ncbi:unnamed protein product [Porites evermanni]|uniref:Acyltransferase C-terminal domain-containing protein n=1 Tax=Porites evermanni TaxID=104178 RepID=A0ABN8PWV8_9CNID|nr:unnamed protein product [Porites evermanni]
MQNALYIFLKRRWEQDESYLNTVLSYFVDSSACLQLLLFPEGTNLEEGSKVKSDSFAEKNNLPCYDYVLHPRVRGFTYCIEKLRQGRLDAIHDVTIGYSQNYCFQEMDLLKGNVPDEIHFHLRRYSDKELPRDTKGLEAWCCERWEEKEERLKNFYTKSKQFGPPPELASETEITVRYLFLKCLIFWVAFAVCISLLLYASVLARWWCCVGDDDSDDSCDGDDVNSNDGGDNIGGVGDDDADDSDVGNGNDGYDDGEVDADCGKSTCGGEGNDGGDEADDNGGDGSGNDGDDIDGRWKGGEDDNNGDDEGGFGDDGGYVVEMIMVTRVVTVCYGGEISGVSVMMMGVMVCYGGDGVYDDDGGDDARTRGRRCNSHRCPHVIEY